MCALFPSPWVGHCNLILSLDTLESGQINLSRQETSTSPN
jgi:hypothetical protein